MRHVELPEGHWAVLREAKDMSHRSVMALRKSAQDAIGRSKKWQDVLAEIRAAKEPDDEGNRPMPSDEEMWAALLDFADEDREPFEPYYNLAIELTVKEWDDGLGPVIDAEAVLDLPQLVHDALVREMTGIVQEPEFSPDGAADPKAPTANSNASSPTSEGTDAPRDQTTPTPASTTTS